jgi:hypothetical protein
MCEEKQPKIHHEAHENHEENFRFKIKKISNRRFTQIDADKKRVEPRIHTNEHEFVKGKQVAHPI